MCGILVAIRKKDGLNESYYSDYHRALNVLSWRGPDLKIESTFFNQLYLGQTILSLTGNAIDQGQHLQSKSGRYVVAFNGEIYNYRDLRHQHLSDILTLTERQLTDSEVLVNLFDKFKLEKVSTIVDGMYAYTLFDKETKKLIVSRDPQGEKTLYIYEDSEVIYIASEIRAILELKKKLTLDPQVFRDYFSTRHFMFSERTPYQGIRQLKPGVTLSYDLVQGKWTQDHEISMSAWINHETYQKNNSRSLDDLTDELDSIIDLASKEMVPLDRDFASVVSGGVDSSLLSHYALQNGNPKVLLAVNHVGKDEISHNLSGFEKVFNRKIQMIDVDRVIYSQSLIQCQKTLSGPIFSHSFIGQSLQSQYARGQGCLAMFGGEGADELFGGYSAYLDIARRKIDIPYSSSPYSQYKPLITFKNNQPSLMEKELGDIWTEAKKVYSFLKDPEEQAAQAMMYCDLAHQLPSVGFRGSDIMSMMWSVEARSVFVRRKIVKFALNLPLQFKADRNEKDSLMASKKILKNLFLRKFPRELLVKKQGFAGFPNESGAFLGEMKYFKAIEFLGLDPKILDSKLSPECHWKLVNTEFYLRNQ